MEKQTNHPNRQKFAMRLGLGIVAFHMLLTLFVIYIFGINSREEVHEIILPITAAYVSALVKWFFDTNGIVTSKEPIGMPLILVILIIVGGLMIGLAGATIHYEYGDRNMLPEELKKIYLWLEVSFGGMFGIIMSELYGAKSQ